MMSDIDGLACEAIGADNWEKPRIGVSLFVFIGHSFRKQQKK